MTLADFCQSLGWIDLIVAGLAAAGLAVFYGMLALAMRVS